jgi:hypothetical protein
MSVKNKVKDRNEKGKIIRKYTRKIHNNFPNGEPSWWTNLHMNKPKRRENKKICRKVKSGVNTDDLSFPLGNRKPHLYYW